MPEHEPKWYKQACLKLEPVWKERLNILGTERVRSLIQESSSEQKIVVPNSPRVVNPDTELSQEANPSIEFAISWLTERLQDLEQKSEIERNFAIRMQRIALIISIVSAAAGLLNIIRLFIQTTGTN